MSGKILLSFMAASFPTTLGCALAYWLHKMRGSALMACWLACCLVFFLLNWLWMLRDGGVAFIITITVPIMLPLMISRYLTGGHDVENGVTDLIIGLCSMVLFVVSEIPPFAREMMRELVHYGFPLALVLPLMFLNTCLYAIIPVLLGKKQRLIYGIKPISEGFNYSDRMISVDIKKNNVKKVSRHRGLIFNRIIIDGSFIIKSRLSWPIKGKRVVIIERNGLKMEQIKSLLSIP